MAFETFNGIKRGAIHKSQPVWRIYKIRGKRGAANYQLHINKIMGRELELNNYMYAQPLIDSESQLIGIKLNPDKEFASRTITHPNYITRNSYVIANTWWLDFALKEFGYKLKTAYGYRVVDDIIILEKREV